MRVLITDKGGNERTLEFAKREITLGRGDKSDVILDDAAVSRYHAKIVEKDGKHILMDLKSDNGVFVNKKRVRTPVVVSDRDEIRIGTFFLRVTHHGKGLHEKG